jgi:hypothetical protein
MALSWRALQRYDETLLRTAEDAPKPKEATTAPGRDLEMEYVKQRRLDSMEASRRTPRHPSHAADRGAGADGKRSTSRASTPRAWHKYYKVGFEPEGAVSPSPRRPRSATPPSVMSRSATSMPERQGEDGKLKSPRAAPTTPTSAKPQSLKSHEQLFWNQYQHKPVVSRLLDRAHWSDAMTKLRDEDRKRFYDECPFEPALCIATVMGTYPGSKRKSATAQAQGATQRGSTPGVRFVTIHHTAPDDDEEATRANANIDVDDVPPPSRRNVAVRRDNQLPHYMEPLAVPPPVDTQVKIQLTPRARRLQRSRKDLNLWAEERRERLADAQVTAEEVREAQLAAELRSPMRNRQSIAIVDALGDRRIDVFARAEMDSMARRADAAQRIKEREELLKKDMKVFDAEAAPKRTGRKQGGATEEKVSLAWFTGLVRADTAYPANRVHAR